MEKPPRCLIADVDARFRTSLSVALKQNGVLPEMAETGAVAADLFHRHRYDAVITELRLPEEHGHRLITRILEEARPAPLIFVVTSIRDVRLVQDLLARGVADVMWKPIAVGLVAAKVTSAILRGPICVRTVGPTDGSALTERIDEATASLREQLARVTRSFDESISELANQRDRIESGYLGSIRMFANLVSQFGNARNSHAGRTEILAECIGTKIGLNDSQLRALKLDALLHDIGQFGMPDAFLSRPPWQLHAADREAYEKYPSVGAALLSEIPYSDEIVEIVEGHAENFDGSGFPRKLRGEAIPLSARIVRIADAYDTYLKFAGPGEGVNEAMQYLASKRGTVHDPGLFQPAIDCIRTCLVASEKPVRTVDCKELVPGMVLAENVYDEEARFLCREGVTLTANLAHRLRALLVVQKVAVCAEEPLVHSS